MNYTDLSLFGLGLAGLLIHNLIKVNELNRKNDFSASTYFKLEWPSISINVIVILVCLVCKQHIAKLENAGIAIGPGFVAIGYMGQSLFVKAMRRTKKFLDSKMGSDEQ